ncbi:MAG: dTDP-glucose 4,6-dehydratase [Prochlorotrichaceae cyanobacterium]|jgi:dTDP-glucose 4,6-dehydratase
MPHSSSQTRSLLVTGAAGFIGSNFVHYWHDRYPQDQIVVLDALTYAGHRQSLADLEAAPNFRFYHGSINDRALVDQLCQTHQIDHLVHFAAESHVDRSILNPGAFIETNVVGTFVLLEAFYAHWKAQGQPEHYRFHHVSTDEVFGSLSPTDPAFSETTPYAPNSPYSASKAGSDHLVRSYHHTYGLPTLMTNCSNNYGPYQFPEKLIPLMIVNILQGKPLPVYGDGQNVRDWLYVKDHCEAIDRVLQAGKPGETYGIGGEAEVKNIDLVTQICQIMDAKVDTLPVKPARNLIEYVTDRPGHDRRYAMNISKIRQELDWSPTVTLEQGLEQTIDWYLAQPQWWQTLLKG